ncbi:unnamed protein product [Ixodes persulcatus]
MVSVNEEAHASASHCAICGESFGNRKRTVRDHDHFSGSYRQSLCQGCNLNLRVNKEVIPVLAHNHSYDLAFILPKLDLFECLGILKCSPLAANNLRDSTWVTCGFSTVWPFFPPAWTRWFRTSVPSD